MTSTPTRATRSRRRPGRVRAFLAIGTVLGVGAVATLAQFTDEAKLTATFTTGSVDLTFDTGEQGTGTPYTFADWSDTSLSPGGDSYASLTVNNDGSLPFTYTISAPDLTAAGSSEALAGAMLAGARVVTGACTQANYEATSAIVVVADAAVDELAISTARPLAAGASETLCFMASLPASATGTAVQGQTVNPVFTFLATQTTTP